MEYRNQEKTFPLGTEPFPLRKQILFLSLGWLGFQVVATMIQIFVGTVYGYVYHVTLVEAL